MLPYRASLGKADKPILLLLDGHASHCVLGTVELCAQNNITTVLLPAHTSHVLQPLDVGIFQSYKAAWRKSNGDSSLRDLTLRGVTAASQNRVFMLGRSLIAFTSSFTKSRIKRAFKHTGIYPPSLLTFIAHCKGVRDVPDQISAQAKELTEREQQDRSDRILGKRRRSIVDEAIIVGK